MTIAWKIRKIFAGKTTEDKNIGPTANNGFSTEQAQPTTHFVYAKIPEDIQPIARGDKYEDPIENLLNARNLGAVTGGGSQLGDNNPDGSVFVEYCGLDIDLTDLQEGLALLRQALQDIGAPIGSQLHYSAQDSKLQDELHDTGWILRQPRTFLHPGFGV